MPVHFCFFLLLNLMKTLNIWLKFYLDYIHIYRNSVCFMQEYVEYVKFGLKLVDKIQMGHMHESM